MSTARRNVAAALTLIGVAVGYGVLTAGLPDRTLPNTPGPAFFPWLITGLTLLLSLALLVQGVAGARRPAGGGGVWRGLPTGAVALVCFALYLAVLPATGFLWASIPFFAVLMVLYDGRRWTLVAGSSVAIPVVLYFLFRDVFQILLP